MPHDYEDSLPEAHTLTDSSLSTYRINNVCCNIALLFFPTGTVCFVYKNPLSLLFREPKTPSLTSHFSTTQIPESSAYLTSLSRCTSSQSSHSWPPCSSAMALLEAFSLGIKTPLYLLSASPQHRPSPSCPMVILTSMSPIQTAHPLLTQTFPSAARP